ncbi:chromosome partitioning protein [Anopheles sinensis]|uniref:Chromosome partitioning protein n=1 Tax=Anopheles sinensis TaxID=74873 RepID=A0A084VLP3_ANOSI|nr:chromosome partitioning protein [Anopheles sinensis]
MSPAPDDGKDFNEAQTGTARRQTKHLDRRDRDAILTWCVSVAAAPEHHARCNPSPSSERTSARNDDDDCWTINYGARRSTFYDFLGSHSVAACCKPGRDDDDDDEQIITPELIKRSTRATGRTSPRTEPGISAR